MYLNKLYDYPDLEQVTFENGTRYYVCPEGSHLHSVTTILDATSDKTSLLEWKKFVGEAKAKQISKQATDIGSLMHTHVEAFVEGVERPSARTPHRLLAKEMADRIIEQGVCHVSEVWGIETRQYVPGLYAGTCDLVGIYKGRPAIIDHKSAKKMRTLKEIETYPAQLGAYAIAHDELYGTDIDTGVIFMSTRDGKFKAFEFTGQEFKRARIDFLDRVSRYLDIMAD